MGVLEYFDFPDLPFLCSLALVEVCAGMKHTWTDSHTDRNVQTFFFLAANYYYFKMHAGF